MTVRRSGIENWKDYEKESPPSVTTNLKPTIMNEKQMAKLYYLKRLLGVYIKFLPRFESYEVVFNESTKQVEVKFFKKVQVVYTNGETGYAENKSEAAFYATELGRTIVVYKSKLREKFKNRHKWNG